MNLLRKLLVFLRKEYVQNKKPIIAKVAAANVLLFAITMLVDWLLPMGGLPNLLRSVLLVPTAVSVFAGLYLFSLFLHFRKVYGDEPWTPFRARYSPAWRRRIAVIVAALLVVLAQAITPGVGYTFSSSILGAIVIAAIAFIRTNREEAKREELGIPDSRDVLYDAQKRRMEKEKALKSNAKQQKRVDFLKGDRKFTRK